MKWLKISIAAGLVLGPTGGCVALGIIIGQDLVTNPEMAMLLKVGIYLLSALLLVFGVILMLLVTILAIGKGLGLAQGDTRTALQTAIALARGSSSFNRLYGRFYNRLPRGNTFPLPMQQQQQPYYQYNGQVGGEPLNNTFEQDTESTDNGAWAN